MTERQNTQKAFITARNNFLNITDYAGPGNIITINNTFIESYTLDEDTTCELRMLTNKILAEGIKSPNLNNYAKVIESLINRYRELDRDSIIDGIVIFTAFVHARQLTIYGKQDYTTVH